MTNIQIFNWRHYLNNNQDLADAGINTPNKLWSHWHKYGKYENRKGCPIIEPVPEPEPVAQPKPEPEPVAQPKPEPESEPKPEPEPVAQHVPEPEYEEEEYEEYEEESENEGVEITIK